MLSEACTPTKALTGFIWTGFLFTEFWRLVWPLVWCRLL